MNEKQVLMKASRDRGAHIEVKLSLTNLPCSWIDKDVFHYFKRFGNIIEARTNKEKNLDKPLSGSAILKCLNFHEAETILKIHREKKCSPFDLRDKSEKKQSVDQRSQKYTESEYSKLSAFNYYDTEINPLIKVAYADGELERLGIINIDPFDLNG